MGSKETAYGEEDESEHGKRNVGLEGYLLRSSHVRRRRRMSLEALLKNQATFTERTWWDRSAGLSLRSFVYTICHSFVLRREKEAALHIR